LETLRFVGSQHRLHPPKASSLGTDDPPEDKEEKQKEQKAMKNVQLPLSADLWATLSAPFPLSESAWNQMVAILNAMKPALVADIKPADEKKPDEKKGAEAGEWSTII
jgi:hypothetical protein